MLTDPEEDYARGFVPFLGITVCLDSRPLIPRTETEYWTERAIKGAPHDASLRALDLFAGSGASGLAVLAHLPSSHVTFAEIKPQHLLTIQKSIEVNGFNPLHTTLLESDVWSAVNGVFDLIVANPPYISQERNTTEESVLSAEPHEALFADDDGFTLIQKTIEGLSEHLAPNGALWIEHEPHQSARLQALGALYGFSIATERDQYNVERFSVVSHAD